MKLRKIIIKNFRNLRNISIKPAEKTVIIGENNSGKSNFLYALRLILDPNSKRLENDLSSDDINDIAFSQGDKQFSITIEIGCLNHHQELEAIFMESLDRTDEETFVTIQGLYIQDDDGNFSWNIRLLPPAGSAKDPELFTSRMFRSIPLYYLDAIRSAEKELRLSSRGTFSDLLKNIDLSDVSPNVISNIRAANEALNLNTGINTIATGISDLLEPQMPGGESRVSIRVANEDPSQLLKDLHLGLKRQNDSKEYDISRHGTGLQNLVLIAMFRHKIATAGKNQPILAIEEPESHLHPHAQRCLFKDLEKIKNPILLTTHSPEIVECCDPLGLIKFSVTQHNEVTTHQINSQTFDKADLKLLERMLRSGRADSFFAKTMIIVEGASEVIALPAFAEQIGYNLDREGISIVSADGNSFAFILNSCSKENFYIPSVVTFDSDACFSDNSLVREAFKSGYISKESSDSVSKDAGEKRLDLLKSIGWIPAIESFEEEIGECGYLPLILRIIEEEGLTQKLDEYLSTNTLAKDPKSVARFIRKSAKRLKVPIASTIALEVKSINRIPLCYDKAIREAVRLSSGNGLTI